MAYDKIIVVRARLDNRIRYALNEAKTQRLENGQVLQTAINCQLDTAYRNMQETKRRWDKENRPAQGYHIIHSFSPGEVMPELAHRLSVEFAERLLQGRFEAVVATHIDHGHIHAHIVFNSVSCVDGKMFRDDFKAYYGDIRGISNEISRENDLSVIEPKGKGKHYAEWDAERDGKETVRGLIRQDIDAALADAFTLQSFFDALQKRGYTIKRGANVKHTAIKPPGSDRFVRLDSLGDGCTEADIRERLNRSRTEPEKLETMLAAPLYVPRGRYKVKRRSPPYEKNKSCPACAVCICIICICFHRPGHGDGLRRFPCGPRSESSTNTSGSLRCCKNTVSTARVSYPCLRTPCKRILTPLFFPGASCTAVSGAART